MSDPTMRSESGDGRIAPEDGRIAPEDGRIERWLDERSRHAPPPDRELVLRRTLERLPEERQRPLWWPLSVPLPRRGASRPDSIAPAGGTARTRDLPRLTRGSAALVIASLVVLSGVALMRSGPTLGPGATPASPGPESAARVSGSLSLPASTSPGGVRSSAMVTCSRS